jgi:hypothetical protein
MVAMSKLKIEQFVEQHFGIKLMPAQLEMIAMIAANPEKHFEIVGGRSAGKTTAYKAAMAYLQDGMKPADFDTGTSIDFGELMLETAKNAPHVQPNMQNAIAKYLDYQSAPKMYIKPVNINLEDIKR